MSTPEYVQGGVGCDYTGVREGWEGGCSGGGLSSGGDHEDARGNVGLRFGHHKLELQTASDIPKAHPIEYPIDLAQYRFP